MKSDVANPFDRWGLDPTWAPSRITRELRVRLEETTDPAEQADLRADWERLTKHAHDRVMLAWTAFHDRREPILREPPPRPAPPPESTDALDYVVESASAALGPETDEERAARRIPFRVVLLERE